MLKKRNKDVVKIPFKSKSQVRRFGVKLERGEISKATFEKWKKHTPSMKKLPERAEKKKK